MPFDFVKTEIPDVVIVKPKVFEDDRGFFMETYRKDAFDRAGISSGFVQDNHSWSRYGVLRGLHFQRDQYAQAKLVRCVKGTIFDVAVDLRRDSPTFGNHVGVTLSESNRWMLYVPRGFAHGFVVLSDQADVVYKVDNLYSPDHEGGLIWNDPDVGIDWPIDDPILSEKDRKWPNLRRLKDLGWLF